MDIKILKCAECGCEFTASIKSTKAKYCENCTEIVAAKRRNEYNRRHYADVYMKKSKSKSISSQSKIEEIMKLAAKHNMSYGEYQAMLRSKQEVNL